MNPDVLSRKNSRIALAALAMVSCAALSAPAAAQWGARYNVPGPEIVAPDHWVRCHLRAPTTGIASRVLRATDDLKKAETTAA